jgi:Ca2+:H+ antiporter
MPAPAPVPAPVSVHHHRLPIWSWALPVAGWGVIGIALGLGLNSGIFAVVILAALIGSVLASVHHAEVIAHRIGEPFGTLVLAIAVTVVELSLIVTLMLAGGEEAYALARDSAFAAFMIATTGIVGGSLLVAGMRYREGNFQGRGAATTLSALAALAVLTLVMPNYTTGAAGPVFTPKQLAFVAVVSLALYLVFVFVQTVRHRNYFLSEGADDENAGLPPSRAQAIQSLALLLVGLVAVVVLAKSLAPALDATVVAMGAPRAAAGVAIAALVMLPEGLSALRAARANHLQTSLNLALGSALATIGLTIPGVAAASFIFDEPVILGIGPEEIVLLTLTLLISSITLVSGRATILQGAVHLTIFAVFLLLSFAP